jgi:hypothetical protein
MFEIDNLPYGLGVCLCVTAVLLFASASSERFLAAVVVTCVLSVALAVGYHGLKSSRGFGVGTSWRAAVSVLLLCVPSVAAMACGRSVVRRSKLLAVLATVVVYVFALVGSTVLEIQSGVMR